VNEQHFSTILQITGHVRSMFFLMDDPATALIIQIESQLITARASG
jgi:hypothetical protein